MRIILVAGMLLVARLAWADTAVTEEAAAPAAVEVAQASGPAASDNAVAPELLGVTQNAKGNVYYRDDRRWEAWVTIGSEHGLRPNAQVDFLRNGKVVAQGVVKSVKSVDAIVTPNEGTPAGTILLGDEVRVTCNGTRADLEAVIARERRTEALGTMAITAIIATCIFAERYDWLQLD